jgi:hypothetical protein
VPVHLGYGGEQMSNLIFIDTRVYKLPQILERYFDFLIAHETGHQWFYNIVGVNEYTQMWLEEGVHSYFIEHYLDKKYGSGGEVIVYPAWFEDGRWLLPRLTFRQTRDTRYKTMVRTGFDQPVMGELSSFREPGSIFSLAYGKGARITQMLNGRIGEEAFNKIFLRIFREYRFKNLEFKDFQRLAEEESGQDVGAFFQDWLYEAKALDYAVKKGEGDRIILENRGAIAMPADVEIEFADGTTERRMSSQPGSFFELKTKGSSPIVRVSVDPDQRLLDINRTNNSWPRKVHVHPVPLYLGLYDIPVFLPDDGYNIVFGPEIHRGVGIKASLQKPYDQILYTGTSYEFGEELHHSRLGYQLNNLFQSPTALGVELSNTHGLDDGDDDVASGKLFLRKELLPAVYSLGAVNDHVTLYLLRNIGLKDRHEFVTSSEEADNIDYSRRHEAITGIHFHLDRSGPFPDPRAGYHLDTLIENAGHFLGADQFFYRAAAEATFYQPVTTKTTAALQLKYAWGYPSDKELFYLGGDDGLRGFRRKSIRGSHGFLSRAEYRFPFREDLKLGLFDNLLGLEKIGGVVFWDAGEAWFGDFDESRLHKDAGVGLRMTVNIASFIERAVVRADCAFPINEDDNDQRFWLGLNHAF